jgi:hypothetical protein
MRKREIRMSDELWGQIDEVSRQFKYNKGKGGKSKFIRDMVSDLVAIWKHAPYVCTRANVTCYISADGHFLFRTEHDLSLSEPRSFVPGVMAQRLEKILAYTKTMPKTIPRDEWLRKKWIFNYFSLRASEEILDEHTDIDGGVTKSAMLKTGKDTPWDVTREMIWGLESYVQWVGDQDGDFDRIVSSIHLPTRNLSVSLIIDETLFGGTMPTRPELVFMNGEQVPYSSRDLLNILDSRPRQWSGHVPEGRTPPTEVYNLLQGDFGELLARIRNLKGKSIGEHPVIRNDAREAFSTFRVPKGYLFFRLEWPTPPLGLSVSVQFRKPPRREAAEREPREGEGVRREA